MIEAAQAASPAQKAIPDRPVSEQAILLSSAAGKLEELAGMLIAAGDRATESEKDVFVQIATGFHEVLQTFRLAIQEGSPPPPAPPVAGGGITPDNDPMESRIKSLEVDTRDARDRLVRVEVKLDNLEKKVDLLPSKDFVVSEVSRSATKIITWVVVAVGAAQLIPSLIVPLLKHYGL